MELWSKILAMRTMLVWRKMESKNKGRAMKKKIVKGRRRVQNLMMLWRKKTTKMTRRLLLP